MDYLSRDCHVTLDLSSFYYQSRQKNVLTLLLFCVEGQHNHKLYT